MYLTPAADPSLPRLSLTSPPYLSLGLRPHSHYIFLSPPASLTQSSSLSHHSLTSHIFLSLGLHSLHTPTSLSASTHTANPSLSPGLHSLHILTSLSDSTHTANLSLSLGLHSLPTLTSLSDSTRTANLSLSWPPLTPHSSISLGPPPHRHLLSLSSRGSHAANFLPHALSPTLTLHRLLRTLPPP